jgi:hypothetical protein
VDLATWQWIFFLNVPAGIITLLAIYVVAGGIETPRARGGIDLLGAALISGSLLVGVAALTLAGQRGWTDPLILGGLALTGVLLAAFVALELRLRSPIVDPRLFADRRFSAANLVSLLTGYTLATAIIGGPVFVNRVLNAGADESALALTALTVAIAAGAVVGGVLSGLVGERVTTVGGVAVTVAALYLATSWGTEVGLDRLVRDLAIYGAGFGLTVSPRATAAVDAAGSSAYGVASAMLQITRTIGMSVGLALLTSIGQNRIDELTALINDAERRNELVVALDHPEFVNVDPRNDLLLVDLLEDWSRGQAAEVLQLVLTLALVVAVATLLPAFFVGGRVGLRSRPAPPR